jgi:hypothetical protein
MAMGMGCCSAMVHTLGRVQTRENGESTSTKRVPELKTTILSADHVKKRPLG